MRITTKGRKECIHIPIPICYAMDAVQKRVEPISSLRLCINAAEYSLIGGWGACWSPSSSEPTTKSGSTQ